MINTIRVFLSLFILSMSLTAYGAENELIKAQGSQEMSQIGERNSQLLAQQNDMKDEIPKLKMDQQKLRYALGRQYDGFQADIKSLKRINESLQADIRSVDINFAEQTKKLQDELEYRTKALFSAVVAIIVVIIIGALYARKKIAGTQLLEKIIEQDSVLVATLNKQIDTAQNIPKFSTQDITKEGHAFPVRVGSEIYRMRKRIESMDESTKGLPALKNALNRLEDDLNQRGYIINDLSGSPYLDELTVKITNTIERDDLEQGSQIINRMIEPQLLFNGVVVGHGEVELAVGVKK